MFTGGPVADDTWHSLLLGAIISASPHLQDENLRKTAEFWVRPGNRPLLIERIKSALALPDTAKALTE